MSGALLELREVTKVFRTSGVLGLGSRLIRAVDRVSFSIPEGKPVVTALVGESGSGKSTIARMILGLETPTSGEILYRGRSIERWLREDPYTYRREVQVVFQDPYSVYNSFYRVERVLYMAVRKFGLASSREEARKMIVEAMERLGLRPQDVLGRYPHQLSGGERQRLMLVRALLIKPRLLVADEPVSMIDASLRAIFLENLLQLKEELGMSCLYITHDLNIANYVADDILVICNGCLVETGPAREVFEDPLHPYTKVLVGSVPVPDPRRRWRERLRLEVESFRELRVERGCPFQYRCPHVTDVCREKLPPLAEVRSGRRVRCWLFAHQG